MNVHDPFFGFHGHYLGVQMNVDEYQSLRDNDGDEDGNEKVSPHIFFVQSKGPVMTDFNLEIIIKGG